MKARTISAAVLLALGVTLAAGGPARAGESTMPRSRPHGSDETVQRRVALRLQDLAAKLGLTADQKTTVRPILEAEANAMRALRVDTAISPSDQQAEFNAIHEKYREQLQAVLTPDQRTRLDALQKEARAKLDESAGQKRKGRIPVSPDVD